MTLWQSRIPGEPDPASQALNSSLEIDRRLAPQDLRASVAWATALDRAGVILPAEADQIRAGLAAIRQELEADRFAFAESDEDIHTAVERRLGELIGSVAGNLHTGRSRNDQVATDFRLWLLDHLPALDTALAGLQTALLERADSDKSAILPGYTHMQRAQPILLSHWWLAHFWPLLRDRERLAEVRRRTAQLPLGSAALAGTAYAIDRQALAAELGFDSASTNSLDAVADRDFAVEFLAAAALAAVHLSRLAGGVLLFSTAEFGFFEISDAFATGSSQMPQKRNADVFELARGKTGALIGHLAALLTTLKGLPSAYDRDLQEDKPPVFAALDTLALVLPALSGAVRGVRIHRSRMLAALEPELMATDLADYLVDRGVAFREAFAVAAAALARAHEKAVPLSGLSLEEFRSLHPVFESDVAAVFDPERSISRRAARGGTSTEAVSRQIDEARHAWQAMAAGVHRQPIEES